MSPNRTCPNSGCPNRGMLAIDANCILFLVEGAIKHAQTVYPDLTNAARLPHILEELDGYLGTFRRCCSLDQTLYISNRVFDEVSLDDRREIARKGLIELKKYSNTERRDIFQVLRNHFPQPTIVPDREIRALRGLFHNQDICPFDRDASLMVVVCHLATNELPTIVLTDDPDFIAPIKWLMRQESVIIGEELTFTTNRIMYRDYLGFLWRLHDCCSLPTARYEPLANAYHTALVTRLPKLKRQEVLQRDMERLRKIWAIHTESIRLKGTGSQPRW